MTESVEKDVNDIDKALALVEDWKKEGIAENLLWHMPYIHGIKSDDVFMAKLVDELLYKVALNQIGATDLASE